ncbi:MAG TPA: FAD-linked oxidase C-terminal domain-containing protein [Terriglobales bacterium]|nr:FAD-linked oxidase C-terminal domain-containing protein [Terriglobales bacterium]
MQKLVALTPAAHNPSILPPSSHDPSKHKRFAEAHELEKALKEIVKGEVRFGDGDRALYATDGSNYRQVPIGVVVPRDVEDAIATMRLCRMYGAPVLSRGGGTSLCGQCCNFAVILDFSKYCNQLLELNHREKYARVQPGIVLDTLRKAAEHFHLTFGPDPATHNHCTLGGMIGNNSCGVHALMAGKTEENVYELDILTYDGLHMKVGETSEAELEHIIREGGRRGEIYSKLKALRDKYANLIRERYPNIPRRVSGYNLNELLPENHFNVARALVGSEATCVMVLEAKLRLVYSPPARTLVVLGYDDVYAAGDHVPEVLTFKPIGLEGIDNRLVGYMKKKGLHVEDLALLPDGKGFLLVEFGGENKEESDMKARAMMARLKAGANAPKMKLYDDKKQEKLVWEIRESGLGATAFVPGEPVTWEGWEDSAVPPDKVGHYLRDLRKLLEKHGYNCSLYGHFGQGCIHTRIDFDFRTVEGIRNYRAFISEAADLVVSYGGSISGEHGDGQSKAEMLPKMFGPELVQAFQEFKAIWDPQNKMNPNKVVDPFPIDENLRLGADFAPWQPETHFKFPEDEGRFWHATMRCVGVGKCRRKEEGVMCPSYMVTLEEKHSTRGRAHMLFEMLQGEELKSGWQDESVKEALDLCLSCKGCKGECPVNVDIPTYKAEFMSHYYEKHKRPISAFAFGYIDRWAALASIAPEFANFFSQTPGFSDLMKAVLKIPSQRQIPPFAPQSFRQWFNGRKTDRSPGPQVILWTDTFNNYFHAHTAKAAVEVLEYMGWRVRIPRENLCCGRPLYDFGMLDEAKVYLKRILRSLERDIQAGFPILVLEPSCASVFKEELKNLLPDEHLSEKLSGQVMLLSEFIQKKASEFEFPQLKRKAITQNHCHHKAIFKTEAEEQVFKRIGLDAKVLDSGCCGMAGPFGFEEQKYEVSQACGERVLLPAVREAAEDELILADGFSCREQIRQNTDRYPLHLADVLNAAIKQDLPKSGKPEAHIVKRINSEAAIGKVKAGAALTALLGTAAFGLWAFFDHRNRKASRGKVIEMGSR